MRLGFCSCFVIWRWSQPHKSGSRLDQSVESFEHHFPSRFQVGRCSTKTLSTQTSIVEAKRDKKSDKSPFWWDNCQYQLAVWINKDRPITQNVTEKLAFSHSNGDPWPNHKGHVQSLQFESGFGRPQSRKAAAAICTKLFHPRWHQKKSLGPQNQFSFRLLLPQSSKVRGKKGEQ